MYAYLPNMSKHLKVSITTQERSVKVVEKQRTESNNWNFSCQKQIVN